jgi:hypothetical protein
MNRIPRILTCLVGILAVGGASVTRADYCSIESIPRTADGLSAFDVYGRCTRVATEGQVGPFTIGSSKAEVLGVIEKSNVARLTLLPRVEESLTGFDRKALDVFSDAPGVNVWAHNEPLALEIEFTGNLVVLRNPSLSHFPAELLRLAAKLQPKTTRGQFFDLLASEPVASRLTVAGAVPSGQWVPIPFKDSASMQLALKQSKWRFDGLKAVCPFQSYYSTFKVIFVEDRLVRIEHFCFPYELP